MSKRNVMTSISEDLHNRAKEKGLNVSHELEKALHDKLNGKISDSVEDRKCRCGNQATIWFDDEQCWICNNCLHNEVELIKLTVATKGLR